MTTKTKGKQRTGAPRAEDGLGDQEALFTVPAPPADPVIARAPVGAVTETFQGADGVGTASYDETMTFRFRLSRVWDPTGPRVAWLMLNPSVATAEVLDNTVRRCIGYARAWGAGAIEVVNLFALRSTDPRALYEHPDPVGPGNDDAISAACTAAARVVAAWGHHGRHLDRADAVLDLLQASGVHLEALSVTKDHWPGHPLYLPKDAAPATYRRPSA